MTVAGNTILVSDFNGVRNDAVNVISIGSNNFDVGYGQITFSPASLSLGTIVTPGYLNQLRNDLFNARAHQIGTAPAIAESAAVGNIITATDITTFKNYSDLILANRLTANASRMGITTIGTVNRTTSWSSSVTATIEMNFASVVVARHFWNAGSTIRITSSRSGGSSTAQNTSWTNLLNGAGTREFGASTVYTMATSPGATELFITSPSSPYASNSYSILGSRVNVITSASTYRFQLRWQDPYIDPGLPAPGDLVDGTLSYTVQILHPIGGAALSGGGVWKGFAVGGAFGNYPLPTTSLSNITGS